jgi:DnaJ-class molecular chaperone
LDAKLKEPTPRECDGHCDGGYRGMDSCGKCHGTGSVFRIGRANGQGFKRFPNTKHGYADAKAYLNSDRP